MARYRTKDDIDLRWNSIRRRITRELDLQIADFREAALNDLLSAAWNEYKDAIGSGKTLEIESRYAQFVSEVLADVVDVTVEREAQAA